MGNVCSPDSCTKWGDDDTNAPLRNLNGSEFQLRENLNKARRSTKRLKNLTDQQINDHPDLSADTNVLKGQKTEASLIKKISMVFETNKGRLKQMDQDLKNRYEEIHQFTSQFEVYIGMIQHDSNSFELLSKESNEKLKNEVMEIVDFVTQQQYKDIEETINRIKNIYDVLVMNVKNGEAFDKIL